MNIMDVLIVEDHFLMIEGYKNLLLINQQYHIDITSLRNCEEFYHYINSSRTPPKVVILDLQLPTYKLQDLTSGTDLAVLIRKLWPNLKLIIATSHVEAFLLDNIIKTIKPEGLLVKSDFTPEEFILAFNKIMEGEEYYSETVIRHLKKLGSDDFYLDKYNRQIISLLAQGIASKNLPQYLPLSMSAIDKRKAQIRDCFLLGKGSDEDIIREAKANGYI